MGSSRQQFQTSTAETLEGARRCARLKSPATQQTRTSGRYRIRSRKQQLLGFHRAGPSHDDEVIATYLQVGTDRNLRVQSNGRAGEGTEDSRR